MLDFLTKNFAVISTAITGLAACMAMVFLFAYLSVFDWNLIWIVEYTDIIKFCLIGVAILSSSAWFVFATFDDFYKWIVVGVKHQRYIVVLSSIVPFALLLAYNLNDDFHSENSAKEYHIFSFLSWSYLLWIAVKAMEIYKNRANVSIWRVGQEFGFLILAVGVFGRTYGLKIRDTPDIKHSIILREQDGWRRTFAGATIILITSHHTVLAVAGTIITIPSSDIAQIVGRPPSSH